MANRIAGKHEREGEREREREREHGNLNKLTKLERIEYFHRVKEKEGILEQILHASHIIAINDYFYQRS